MKGFLGFDEISYSWICDACTTKTASTVRECQFCGANLEYRLKQDTWICVGCHKEPTPADFGDRSKRFTSATSRSLLAETIDIDKTPDSCYQYAIKTMQRLGAVPKDQDPPVAFDFKFVETGDRGSIFVSPASDGDHSSVTVCLGTKSQPEQTQRIRGLAKQIIVEMNAPDAVTVRHTGEVVHYSFATSFSLDSGGALLIRCPHCGAQRPKTDKDRSQVFQLWPNLSDTAEIAATNLNWDTSSPSKTATKWKRVRLSASVSGSRTLWHGFDLRNAFSSLGHLSTLTIQTKPD